MIRALLASLVLWVCGAFVEAEAKRVALVIGNGAYRSVSPLANPLNDARLIADALAASGFEVQLGTDLDKRGLEAAIAEFGFDAMQADVAMVYFAGHGVEAGGANWLVPVDANIGTFADVQGAAVPFETVVRSLAGAKVKIVALDACRDNPFAARLQSAAGTINRGLAEVEVDGYVVIYAAAAGQTAQDGSVNSPFALTLARWLREPTIDLRLLAGKIRDDVIAITAGAQRPFVSASLSGDVTVLAPAPAGAVRAASTERRRPALHFDYVRTLRDPSCVQTAEASCSTTDMIRFADGLATVEDDDTLRIWNVATGAVRRSESVASSGWRERSITHLPSASALLVTSHESVKIIPIDHGSVTAKSVEQYDNPVFLLAAGAPPVAIYGNGDCKIGFVDLPTQTFLGKLELEGCLPREGAWAFDDPGSDRLVVRTTTPQRSGPPLDEVVVASYRSRTIICRATDGANDAAFDGGDLLTAQSDGTVRRYDRACRLKQTYRLHQGAVQYIAVLGGRMITRSADGVLKMSASATGRVEKELVGLSRAAHIVDVSANGSAVLILNEDKRLYLWSGEPRLNPYIGPSGPVCGGGLSNDRTTLFALRCEGNVEVWRRPR